MVKIKTILIAVSVLLMVMVAILATVFFFPSEEKKVKKQFALLSEWVSKEPGESAFTMAHKIKSIGTLFAESCDLIAPVHSLSGTYSREEISSLALQSRAQFFDLSLKFYDLNISFPEKGVAKVNLTGKLKGKSTLGETVDETRELDCLLKKIEKKWRFSQFEVIEVLKK
jgi:hypothetical protein